MNKEPDWMLKLAIRYINWRIKRVYKLSIEYRKMRNMIREAGYDA